MDGRHNFFFQLFFNPIVKKTTQYTIIKIQTFKIDIPYPSTDRRYKKVVPSIDFGAKRAQERSKFHSKAFKK